MVATLSTEVLDFFWQNIPDAFQAQVARSPRAIAIRSATEAISYQTLNERSNRLAHWLRAFSFAKETPIGICLDRTNAAIVTMLGILKAGYAYVPLDPAYPQERLETIAADTQIPLLITQETYRDKFRRFSGTLATYGEETESAIAACPSDNLEGLIASEQLAYIIYTSGSTGRPKGVQIEHRNVMNLLQWGTEQFSTGILRGMLASTSFAFDLSVFEIFLPLVCGGSVVLVASAFEMGRVGIAGTVSFLNTVPSIMQALLDAKQVPDSVKLVGLAGEALRPGLVDRIYAETKASKVFDFYGPSETTTYSTFALRLPNAPETVGHGIQRTHVYVLDPQGEPTTDGVLGELYLGGCGVARGYWDRPDLTAERFLPDPFSVEPGARMYRTGDLAVLSENGTVQLRGRADQQVKIHGVRIELGEIEAYLLQHPLVKSAAAFVHSTTQGHAQLVACLAADLRPPLDLAEIKRFLAGHLPASMIPARFIVVEGFPLTPNKKTDRAALARLFNEQSRPLDAAPDNGIERRLVSLFQEILQCNGSLGRGADFFALGGNSLQALSLCQRIEAELQVRLTPVELLLHSTIRTLAQHLAQPSNGSQVPRTLVCLQKGGPGKPIYLFSGAGGHLFIFRHLAVALSQYAPIYGYLAIGVDGREPPLDKLLEIAARYISEMREVQADGPYRLLGWSTGALVAYEVAQQLRASGAEVELLGLLDTRAPRYVPQRLPVHRLMGRYVQALREVARSGNTMALLKAVKRTRFWPPPAAVLIANEQEASRVALPTKNTLILASTKALLSAVRQYCPEPYAGTAVVITASANVLPWADYLEPQARLGWQHLIRGRINAHTVDGTHHTMFDPPYFQQLAEVLARYVTVGMP